MIRWDFIGFKIVEYISDEDGRNREKNGGGIF